MHASTFTRSKVRLLMAAGLAAPIFLMVGCANQSASSSVYSYGQAQREQIVRLGTVVGVRPVTIQKDETSGVGSIAGAAMGGVAASTIGGGRGSVLASIGGALLGGLVGNAVENRMGKSQGLEITVQLDNGETRVVAQEADVPLSVGQRVRMLSGNGPTRVVPM